MRVVVTGATGNVGTSVVEALVAEPAVDAIVGVARRRPRWSPSKTSWATADVAEDDLVPIFDGADAVVHLAWMFQPTHDPATTWRTNVVGSQRVFSAAAAAGVRTLVHASSVGAYAAGPESGVRVEESWPTHALPTAAYGREKSYVERALDVVERDHPELRVVRLRPAFSFKAQASPEQRRIFAGPLVPGGVIGHRWIPLVPDLPGLPFQAVHSDDVAEAYRLALVRPVRGAFNIAAEPVLDAELLGRIFGRPSVRLPVWPVRAAVALAWHLRALPASPQLLDLFLSLPTMDTTRARSELGWRPRHTSVETMEGFLAGLRHPAGMPTPPLATRQPGATPTTGERSSADGPEEQRGDPPAAAAGWEKLAASYGMARLGLGTALVVAPSALVRRFAPGLGGGAGVIAALRLLGARDLVLGAGITLSSRSTRHAGTWARLGAIADLFDLVAAVSLSSRIGRIRAVVASVAASSGALTGWWLGRNLPADRRRRPG